jgi:RNA ligase
MDQDWLARLNSATKYPSIETYHALDPADGKLFDQSPAHFWEGQVLLTEKVDGANGRVVVTPDGDWFIGSREELLYAKGDRIENPNLGIVPALLPLAPTLLGSRPYIRVYFLEVYGKGIGGAHKQYTRSGRTGYRLFDAAQLPLEILDGTREHISSWRQHGGQYFFSEEQLTATAASHGGIPLVPRLGTVDAAELPGTLAGMYEFLKERLPETRVALDEELTGRAEGIVLRDLDRTQIAKAKFRDYERALRD